MGKVIAIANQKGGVGKTTTSVNLSAAVGAKGKKVLLIDIDPQGNATSGVGINKRALDTTSYDILINGENAEKAVINTKFQGLDVIPSSLNLAAADIEISDKPNRESILKSAITKLRSNYDFIFIDCPPSLGLVTINAMCAADTILVPIQCEFYALEGLSQLMTTLRLVKRKYNSLIDLEGVLLTMYDGRLNLTQQVVDEVKKYFPRKIYSTTIPKSVRLSEAPSFGLPVIYYDKNGKGTVAYNSLADEFLKKN